MSLDYDRRSSEPPRLQVGRAAVTVLRPRRSRKNGFGHGRRLSIHIRMKDR
jgi:hypothetical protein